MRISFLIQAFLIYAHFFENKSKALNMPYDYLTVYNMWCGLHNQLCRSMPQLGNDWEMGYKPNYRGSGFVMGILKSSDSYVTKVTDSILESLPD
jgi:hypothetical protein